jgi:ubiquitin-like domain-containing CTD phosphatase 1
VLDLDHTLLHFKQHTSHKRPHTIEFLRALYPHYDLCVWSQTKWIYIEHKLQELGILGLDSAPTDFKISFILDRTSMFKIKSPHKTKDGAPCEHEVLTCVRAFRVRVCACV